MSTTIPYSPSLVLGSIVEPAAMENLLAISAAQTPIDAAQETLNSFISMKRSLEMTVQELINMGLDPKDLVKKVQEVGTDVDKAATAYATTRLEQELKLQPLRAKMQIVNASVESPIDYNRTQIKALPLAADSLKMDAQFFTFDDNAENDSDTLSNIKSYVSAATSFLGQGVSFDMAKTAVNQVEKQRQMHKISGTLVLTATCTHKEAQVLTPFYLDVDKAIRVWNQLFPGAKDKIRMDETTLRQIAETEGSTTEKSFNIVSGASLGSSFVGMVHVLNTEDTTTSQDDESRAKDMKATLSLGSAIASLKGGFGVDKNFAEDVKRLLSTQNINSHVTLITAGYIPTIKANQVALGVKQFASFDPSDMMTSLAKLSDFTSADRASLQQAATTARTKGEFVALKTASIESVMQSLAKLDDGQNSMLDISSMVVAFEDYVNTAAAATPEAAIGVPINYYLKPITRTQLAQMWVAKYYPNKYLDIQGDDTPRPKQDAAAARPERAGDRVASMSCARLRWFVALLGLLPCLIWAQVPTAPAAPRVSAIAGELELGRIIEVQVDHLADWNQAIAGPAATRTGPTSVHPAWQLVPYLDGRALSGVTPLAVDLGQGRLQFHLRINPTNRDTWTHLLSPLAFQRAVSFTVGLEQVDPFATDFTLASQRAQLVVINWRWWLAAVVIVATLSVAFCGLAMHTTLLMERYRTPSGALAHRFSLAKVQLALWFFVIFSAFLVIWLVTANVDTLNSSILSTLSISAGTALGDTFVKASGPTTATGVVRGDNADAFLAPSWTARRFVRELLSDDEGCSIARFQMLAWTVALVIVFLVDVFDDLQMPVFGPELLYLLGLSTGTYVAHRVPEMQRDRQRSVAAGQGSTAAALPAQSP